MRGTRLALVVLAAGGLALGTSAVFAAESATTTTAPAKPAATTGMSTQKAMAPKPAEVKETKAQQQKELQVAKNREQENGVDRVVRGEVTHVETSANPPTLTVNVMLGKQAETVGVDVPAGAKIMAGKSMKSLADITVGDRVWMRYDRTSSRLVADQIRILGTSKVAKTEQTKAYAKTTVAASKSGPASPAASKSGTSK